MTKSKVIHYITAKDKMINDKIIKEFVSYLFVGAVSTLVEWIGFWAFNGLFNWQYLISTALAFCISTQVNLVLGRKMTFKEVCKETIETKELISIYMASLVGLVFNLVIMYVLVSKLHVLEFVSKMIATGIVFFWNFGVRKFGIYAKK